jgi:7-cyano-7-deazaguanine synthase
MKTIVLHSGGLDSTVLLYKLLRQQDEVIAVAFDYGQRHAKELALGEELCMRLLVERVVVKLPFLETVPSSQTPAGFSPGDQKDKVEVPEGHYAAASMKLTVVPNRNMIMIACAAALGIARKAHRVCFAAHAGDHDIYPDCREEFVASLRSAIQQCDWHKITLHAPFIRRSKAQIVSEGAAMGVPFERTWSCYKGGERACGRCGTCVERLEAFAKAKLEDPLEYEDRGFWQTAAAVQS